MSLHASAYGRLGGDPREISTKSGKAMAVGTLAVDVGDESPLWVGLVAFGRLAEQLLRHVKDDPLSASGRVQVRRWTDTDGTGREQLQLVADALVSARTVRPGGRRKAATGARQAAADDGVPFDDDLAVLER